MIISSSETIEVNNSIETLSNQNTTGRAIATKEFVELNSNSSIDARRISTEGDVVKTIGPTGDFLDFKEAEDWLNNMVIEEGSKISFLVQDGIHNFTVQSSGFLMTLTNASTKIRITGSSATNVTINVSRPYSGAPYLGCFSLSGVFSFIENITFVDTEQDSGFQHIQNNSGGQLSVYNSTFVGGSRAIIALDSSHVTTYNLTFKDQLSSAYSVIRLLSSTLFVYGVLMSTQTNGIQPYSIIGVNYGSKCVLMNASSLSADSPKIIDLQHGINELSEENSSFNTSLPGVVSVYAKDGSFANMTTATLTIPPQNQIQPDMTRIMHVPTNSEFSAPISVNATPADIIALGAKSVPTLEYTDMNILTPSTTAARPVDPILYTSIFDTTLNKIIICTNNTTGANVWVDSLGTVV